MKEGVVRHFQEKGLVGDERFERIETNFGATHPYRTRVLGMPCKIRIIPCRTNGYYSKIALEQLVGIPNITVDAASYAAYLDPQNDADRFDIITSKGWDIGRFADCIRRSGAEYEVL